MISALLCLLLACGGNTSTGTDPAASRAELELGSFQLVNAERAANGVGPRLQRVELLDRVARRHSEEMRDLGFFSHTTPSGQTVRGRLQAQGYVFIAAGENIARVENAPDPAAYAHSLLMENRGHRENILGEQYREVGVGVAIEGRTVWITQIYARRIR